MPVVAKAPPPNVATAERDLVGLDISKPAINIASAGVALENQTLFMVGDLTRLPFADHRLDAIVNILSPLIKV